MTFIYDKLNSSSHCNEKKVYSLAHFNVRKFRQLKLFCYHLLYYLTTVHWNNDGEFPVFFLIKELVNNSNITKTKA